MDESLAALIRRALSAGVKADEIVLRVSGYEADMVTPSVFQAIVRFRDRGKAWGVGVHAEPDKALVEALDKALAMASPAPLPRVRQRVRPNS